MVPAALPESVGLPKIFCPSAVLAAGAGTRVLGFRVIPRCGRELLGEPFPRGDR